MIQPPFLTVAPMILVKLSWFSDCSFWEAFEIGCIFESCCSCNYSYQLMMIEVTKMIDIRRLFATPYIVFHES